MATLRGLGARRRTGPRKVRQAGFTVLELVVAVLVSALGLLLASSLLVEAQHRMALAAEQSRDPVSDLALRQLRADLQASVSAAGSSRLWDRGPLRLLGHPETELEYRVEDRRLLRVTASGSRTVVTGVVTFRWRKPIPGRRLVELELGVRHTARLRPRARELGLLPSWREDRRRLLVTPRAGGGRRW